MGVNSKQTTSNATPRRGLSPWPVALAGLAFLTLAWCAGCSDGGPRTYRVTGIVSYQDKPLPLGMVMFVPQHGPPSQAAAIGPDGRYQLDAVPGSHAVMVVAVPQAEGRPDPNVEGGIDYTDAAPVESLIPEKYNRYETSGITVKVEPVKLNKIDIPLE